MSEHVDHDAETQCGATELGAAIVETGPQLAYSAEFEVLDYPEPVSRLRVALIAGGIVAAAALAATAVVVVGRTRHETPAVPPSPTTTTTEQPLGASLPPAPPPPVSLPTVTTVIVQAPPSVITKAPPPAPVPQLVDYDQQLFNRLTAQGIHVPDYGSMAHDAHLVCARLSNGRSVAAMKDDYAQASGGNYVIAQLFVGDVMAIYPNCP